MPACASGAALLAVGGLTALYELPAVMARLLGGDNQYSLDTRLEAWRILLGKIVPVSPLLGLGPANYYHVTPRFPIRGYHISFSSHSTYVDLLAQTGLSGWRASPASSGWWRGSAGGCTRGSLPVLRAYAIGRWQDWWAC